MQIGEVIRKYRKNKKMTQEEMARRLGVTAPAVNKWENGNSMPDITLLAPIARLFGITTDTLLSYREELTAEEINEIVYEADAMLKEKPYEEAFAWAKKKLEQYPNCAALIWQIAVLFDAQRDMQKISKPEAYEDYIFSLYARVLESNDESLRNHAADSLFYYYMKKNQYDKAEEYLQYFSDQNPEKKRKQAQIYSKTNRIKEAYKIYEELLFTGYQMASLVFHDIYILSLHDKNMKKAHMLVDKQEELARCFEMGKYYEVSGRLELAVIEKDADTAVTVMREMLAHVEDINSFCSSPLYEHMEFKAAREEFVEELKHNLLELFQDEESFGFLKNDVRWRELVNRGKEN